MKTIRFVLGIWAGLMASDLEADVRRVWAVTDGEKIERDASNHPLSARNQAWDGRTIRLFGARNEVVAFQVIVEADAGGVRELTASLPELASASARITYRPPPADPTTGRPGCVASRCGPGGPASAGQPCPGGCDGPRRSRRGW